MLVEQLQANLALLTTFLSIIIGRRVSPYLRYIDAGAKAAARSRVALGADSASNSLGQRLLSERTDINSSLGERVGCDSAEVRIRLASSAMCSGQGNSVARNGDATCSGMNATGAPKRSSDTIANGDFVQPAPEGAPTFSLYNDDAVPLDRMCSSGSDSGSGDDATWEPQPHRNGNRSSGVLHGMIKNEEESASVASAEAAVKKAMMAAEEFTKAKEATSKLKEAAALSPLSPHPLEACQVSYTPLSKSERSVTRSGEHRNAPSEIKEQFHTNLEHAQLSRARPPSAARKPRSVDCKAQPAAAAATPSPEPLAVCGNQQVPFAHVGIARGLQQSSAVYQSASAETSRAGIAGGLKRSSLPPSLGLAVSQSASADTSRAGIAGGLKRSSLPPSLAAPTPATTAPSTTIAPGPAPTTFLSSNSSLGQFPAPDAASAACTQHGPWTQPPPPNGLANKPMPEMQSFSALNMPPTKPSPTQPPQERYAHPQQPPPFQQPAYLSESTEADFALGGSNPNDQRLAPFASHPKASVAASTISTPRSGRSFSFSMPSKSNLLTRAVSSATLLKTQGSGQRHGSEGRDLVDGANAPATAAAAEATAGDKTDTGSQADGKLRFEYLQQESAHAIISGF